MTPQQMAQMRQQAVADLKNDPHGIIKKSGLTVPDDMTDPLQMADYLIGSGQVVGPRAQMARQIMARMGR